MDPKEELAGDIGAAFADGANVGTAIRVTKARAAISAFMIRLLFCPRFAHRRMTDRPAPAGGNMATAVPPRCDADHSFCDDSERFRKATAGGLLAFRSHPNERGTERGESVLCLCGCAVAAVVRARLRTALIEGHLAIVDPLFVARLAAQPFLGGAGRFDAARFAVGTPCRIGRGQRHKKEKRPRNDAA